MTQPAKFVQIVATPADDIPYTQLYALDEAGVVWTFGEDYVWRPLPMERES